MKLKLTSAALAIVAVCTACNPALLAEMGVLQRRSTNATAPNPLAKGSDTPLVAKAEPAQPMLRTHGQPQLCDRGPFEDAYEVSLSADKVCVAVKRAWGGSPKTLDDSLEVEIAADGASRKVKVSGQGDASKIAACTPGPQASYGPFDVYTRDFQGCIPNNGFVSATTKKLVIEGDVTWSFSGG